MCLSKISEEILNNTEFEVYKVVRVINYDYYSPFFLKHIILSNVCESELIPRFDSILNEQVINIGIHSFINIGDAELFKNHLFERSGDKYTILKCIIPVNTRYYSGVFRFNIFNFNCVTSNKIIYLNEL